MRALNLCKYIIKRESSQVHALASIEINQSLARCTSTSVDVVAVVGVAAAAAARA